MFATPTKPNISDYLAFIYSMGVPAPNFPSATGTATGGSTTTLVDAAATWTANQWAGYVVQDLVLGCPVSIVSNTTTTLTFATPLSLPVLAGDKYLIGSQWLFTTYTVAIETVNDLLCIASATLYVLALYNLGLDRLLNYAHDVTAQTYFKDQRTTYGLYNVKVGVPSSSADQGTSTGILNPEFMKTMTLGDLQTMKTPYGRRYMEIAQSFGVEPWGMS